MELAILALLARHQSLAYSQLAAVLHERPYGLKDALATLREHGLVEVRDADEGEGSNATVRWQVTDAGHEELAQWIPRGSQSNSRAAHSGQ